MRGISRARLLALQFIIPIAGCAGVVSERAVAPKPTEIAVLKAGIPYYLPAPNIEITVKMSGDDATYEVKEAAHIPDPKFHYVARYRWSPTADDKVCTTRTPTGLLESVQFASTDQTDAIVVELAKAATKFLVLSSGAFAPAATVRPLVACPIKEYNAKFNPLDEAQNKVVREEINAFLRCHGKTADVDVFVEDPESKERANASKIQADKDCSEGICFRTLVTMPLVIKVGGVTIQRQTVQIPDYRYIGRVDVARALMVKRVTKIGFDKGVLTSFEMSKPSEGLALAKLPLAIIDAIIDIPRSTFNQLAANLSARSALHRQEIELVKVRHELEAVKAAQKKPDPGSGKPEFSATAKPSETSQDYAGRKTFDEGGITCVDIKPRQKEITP